MPLTDIVDIDRDLVYRRVGGLSIALDMYRPRREKPRGAVLLFHAGGLGGGNKGGDTGGLARYLAGEGFLCVDANYRVGTATRAEQTEDAKSAVGWLRQQAVRLNADAGVLAVGGASSGAYLAESVVSVTSCKYFIDLWGPIPSNRIPMSGTRCLFVYGTEDRAYRARSIHGTANVTILPMPGFGHAPALDVRIGDDMVYKHIADFIERP